MTTSLSLSELQTNHQIQVSGLTLHDRGLRAIKRLANRPDVVTYLASNGIVEIAREGLVELERIVIEGRQLNYLPAQRLSGY
jgi:hypothetical protein